MGFIYGYKLYCLVFTQIIKITYLLTNELNTKLLTNEWYIYHLNQQIYLIVLNSSLLWTFNLKLIDSKWIDPKLIYII